MDPPGLLLPSRSSAFFWTKVRSAGSCWPLWLPYGVALQSKFAPNAPNTSFNAAKVSKREGKPWKYALLMAEHQIATLPRCIREGALLFEDYNHGGRNMKETTAGCACSSRRQWLFQPRSWAYGALMGLKTNQFCHNLTCCFFRMTHANSTRVTRLFSGLRLGISHWIVQNYFGLPVRVHLSLWWSWKPMVKTHICF